MKRLYIYSIVVASALTMGALAGFGAKKIFNKIEVVESVDSYIPDTEAIFNEVSSFNGSSKEKVDNFSAVKILNYSLEKFRRNDTCATYTFGVSKSSVVEQLIRGANFKVGNDYFEESLSKSSLVSVANRNYMTGVNGDTSMYVGDKDSLFINDNEAYATFNENEKSVLDAKTYKKTYGKTLDEFLIFLICDEGVKSSNVQETEDGFKYVVDLDNIISVYQNQLQMTNVSKLDTFPQFERVELTFDLDKDLSIKKCFIDEDYKAKKGITASMHAEINIYFISNAEVSIPSVNEKLNYNLEF